MGCSLDSNGAPTTDHAFCPAGLCHGKVAALDFQLTMELHYHTSRDDIKAAYEWLVRSQKAQQHEAHVWFLVGLLALSALSLYLCYKANEIFAGCLVLVLAYSFGRGNWSFRRQWMRYLESCAEQEEPAAAVLKVTDEGLAMSWLGLTLQVPWCQMHEYASVDGRLFIAFLRARCFVIPLAALGDPERDELLRTLKEHRIREAS